MSANIGDSRESLFDTVATAAPSGPVPLHRVLRHEREYLAKPLPEVADSQDSHEALRQVYAAMGEADATDSTALCFSGGGIRSATFNLGVVQALAKAKLLHEFDYLSSVSGGGYIAGWLQAWQRRAGAATVAAALGRTQSVEKPTEPEVKQLDHLRQYSNYLTPKVGLLSTDTWASVAMIVRNMLLNWLVLLPVFALFLAVPQLALLVAKLPSYNFAAHIALPLSLLLGVWTSASLHRFRRLPKTSSTRILWFGLLPLWAATLSLALGWLWLEQAPTSAQLAGFSALWCLGVPIVGWTLSLLGRDNKSEVPPKRLDIAGLLGSGVLTSLILYAAARYSFDVFHRDPSYFVLFVVPGLLGIYLLSRAFYVAFASIGERQIMRAATADTEEVLRWSAEHGYADREWWARLSAWILIASVAWIVLAAISVFASWLMHEAIGSVSSAASLVFGYIAARLGASSSTPPTQSGTAPSLLSRWGVPIACLIAVLAILIMLASFNAKLVSAVLLDPALMEPGSRESTGRWSYEDGRRLLVSIAVPFGAALAAWGLGFVVNVNRFSAHGLYRNRLIRAFLGASDARRSGQVNRFSGFSVDDNLSMHDLGRREKGSAQWPRPLHVVNVALNLVNSHDRLAWQQRKAESFSISPLYCGNFHAGYRQSREYGGKNGISLGTAITISGAAANPSAGYHSSPLTAFLMTLFNVRLGCWLGNTGTPGSSAETFKRNGPRHAWKPLFGDMLGLTDAFHPYVNLSDGGHFENLGVYEMVLRRCRLIVACDAGHDPPHDFEDLGNLVRKVRIDFGIRIEFDEPIEVLRRKRNAFGGEGLVAGLATIHYGDVDPGAKPGRLLYIKPTLRAEGSRPPYDVFSYSRARAQFPHEPTSDQWFDESQFESYRALGEHLVGALTKPKDDEAGTGNMRLLDLFENAESAIRKRKISRQKAAASAAVPVDTAQGGERERDVRESADSAEPPA